MTDKEELDNQNKDKKPLIQGEVPTEEEKQWLKIGQDLEEKSIDSIKTSSEKMTALVAGLITAYITALTYFKIPLNMDFYVSSFLAKTIITLPILSWLFCICLGILAYSAKGMSYNPDSPEEIKSAYHENLKNSKHYFDYGRIFMVIGFILSSIIVLIGSSMQPIPVQSPAEIPAWINYLLQVIGILVIITIIIWVIFTISNTFSEKTVDQDITVFKSINVVNNDSSLLRIVLSRINNYRRYGFGITLFIVLCIVIITYIILVIGVASYVPIPVQFVVNKDQVPVFTNMSINVDNQTMTTMPMTLISEDDKYYRVKTNNQTIIRFNKDMVKGMVYYMNTS